MEVPETVGPSRLIEADRSVDCDFVSKLPDPISLHILSFLPLKDAVRTSIFSKTWKSMWTTIPYLILDEDFMKEYFPSSNDHDFLEMVNKIILNRCNQRIINLEKFQLVIPVSELFPRREWFQIQFNTWVSQMPQIKELELNLKNTRLPGEIDIPSTILSAKSLHVMSLAGFNLVPLSNLDINFASLRTMNLRDAYLDDKIMQQLILGCPLLEDLSLHLCQVPKIIYVTGLVKLKRFSAWENDGMDKLQIDSPDLEILEIASEYKLMVNIQNCVGLKKLLFGHGDFIIDQWLSCLVSRCPFLEDLFIGYSKALKNLKITSNTLKVLKLNSSRSLVEVEINAPRLEEFSFRLGSLRWFRTCLLNVSHTLEVQLKLEICVNGDLYCDPFTKFLANFNHFRKIELCGSLHMICIPKEKRDNLVSPLFAMKHLLLFGFYPDLKFPSVELLEYMLWLCPRADSLWIKTRVSRDYVETEIVLKLLYEDNVCEDSSFPCCKSLLIKCWRHCLVEARVEKLVGLVDTTDIENFFLEHGKNLIL